jgi:protein-tyrosine phosphatase
MLDIHCHILPGVDDGASSLDESLAMARFYARDGVTHVVATPHCHRYCRLLRADILPHVARLNEALAEAGIALTVLPGSEVQVTDSAAYRREFDAGLYCHLGDDPTFTLLEFNQ